jgi:2-haloalkanoic acid dehalogenase type II
VSVKAITLDAYGTLLQNERLRLIPQRIVADHGLSVSIDDVWRMWAALYFEATQLTPFRTLREIEDAILPRLLQSLEVSAPAAPYVDLFFEVTTRAELYPEALRVLNALGEIPVAVVSNADHEHVAAWAFTLPVRFILVSESVKAYKPHPLMFHTALERLGVEPHEVLHVGDSDVDDVQGAKAAGLQVAWVNRDGRPRRPQVPEPDFEIANLTELLTLLR